MIYVNLCGAKLCLCKTSLENIPICTLKSPATSFNSCFLFFYSHLSNAAVNCAFQLLSWEASQLFVIGNLMHNNQIILKHKILSTGMNVCVIALLSLSSLLSSLLETLCLSVGSQIQPIHQALVSHCIPLSSYHPCRWITLETLWPKRYIYNGEVIF